MERLEQIIKEHYNSAYRNMISLKNRKDKETYMYQKGRHEAFKTVLRLLKGGGS